VALLLKFNELAMLYSVSIVSISPSGCLLSNYGRRVVEDFNTYFGFFWIDSE
jgi:hypothetical protein